MIRIVPVAALLLATSCGQADQTVAPANESVAAAPAAPAAKVPVPSLEGKWRLANPDTLDLTIKDDVATLSAGCLRRGFTVRQTGNQATFASSPAGSANCGRAPTLAEETAFAALTDVNLAIFAKDGRSVTLSGFGGMLTAERR